MGDGFTYGRLEIRKDWARIASSLWADDKGLRRRSRNGIQGLFFRRFTFGIKRAMPYGCDGRTTLVAQEGG